MIVSVRRCRKERRWQASHVSGNSRSQILAHQRNALCVGGSAMVGEVFAGISAFNSMFGIAKAIRDIDDTVKRNAAVSDLWEQIIAAQARYTAAVEEVGTLKEELRRFETWETEKQRYELCDLGRGFYAYIMKIGSEQGEPAHALCTNCYQRGIKSILPSSGHMTAHEHSWDCPACKTKIKNPSNKDMVGLIQQARAKN
jgi:hypothetical protein